MPTALRSYGKINIGLMIGPKRDDGFHELRTVYQTLALSDVVKVDVKSGTGIEIRARADTGVPLDETNTCWRISERVMRSAGKRGKVVISIEKALPVQGGLGAASSNAVATLFALEAELKQPLDVEERFRICSEIGSDLNLFLVGGTVLGYGRGEEVLPLEDLPELSMVIVTPAIGVSTPKAFADWDVMVENNADGTPAARAVGLTGAAASVRLNTFSHSVFAWLTSGYRFPASGVPASGGDRAEAPLLDLVRTGIENDFERVVFPQHPELRDIKRALYGREGNGARYASLSGSGSTMYGLFDSAEKAERIAGEVRNLGHTVLVTTTLTRQRYWGEMALKQ